MLGLHERYGDIVRIGPDMLAFSHPDAWKDIMGHQKPGQELGKAMWFYRPVESEPTHIVNEGREEHGRLRRQMANGFSEKAMRDQEPLIKRYVDTFIEQIRDQSQGGQTPVVLSDWYNYCTFDIIGDLAFGESFGCLDGGKYHQWIAGIFQSGRLGTILQMLSFVPSLKDFLMKLAPKSAREAHEEHKKMCRAKMLKRMENSRERPDLIEGLLRKKEELVSNKSQSDRKRLTLTESRSRPAHRQRRDSHHRWLGNDCYAAFRRYILSPHQSRSPTEARPRSPHHFQE